MHDLRGIWPDCLHRGIAIVEHPALIVLRPEDRWHAIMQRRDELALGCIKITTSKRQVAIDLDVLPVLRQAPREAPVHDAIKLCANSRGRPWTESGFCASFFKKIRELEAEQLVQPGLTFHGLRHTVATILAEAGVSAEDIAAVLGQESSEMAEHHSKEANRSRRSKAAIREFEAA
jgi:integrase